MPAPTGPVSAYPPAGLDRRFYAFTVDRLIAWPLYGLAGFLGYRLFFADGRVWFGVALVSAVVLVVGLVFAVLTGVVGTSPGKAMLGLRVVRAEGGTPIGIGRALLRTLVLGAAALPTFGFGVATLAQTAVTDRGRQRRGWHDHLGHSVVVDIRPPQEIAASVVDDAPRQVVNLTAMRLAPAPVQAPPPTPPRRQPGPPPTPRQSLPGPPPTAGLTLPPGAPPGRTPAPAPPAGAPSGPPPGVPPGPPPGGPPAPSDRPPGPPPAATTPRATPVSSADSDRTVVRGGSAPAPAAAGWRVSFDTGETFLVEGLGLVGRRPEGRPGEPVRHLVPLPSQDMSVSKTHAQFQVASDGVLVVMDRGSTNGSMLVRSGVARELPPGKPTTLLPGDLVRFGDRSMTVVRES